MKYVKLNKRSKTHLTHSWMQGMTACGSAITEKAEFFTSEDVPDDRTEPTCLHCSYEKTLRFRRR